MTWKAEHLDCTHESCCFLLYKYSFPLVVSHNGTSLYVDLIICHQNLNDVSMNNINMTSLVPHIPQPPSPNPTPTPPSAPRGRDTAAFYCLPDNKVTSFWWRMSLRCFVSEGGAIRCDPINGESKYFQSIKVHWCCICSHPSSEVLTSPRESLTLHYSKSLDPYRSKNIVFKYVHTLLSC